MQRHSLKHSQALQVERQLQAKLRGLPSCAHKFLLPSPLSASDLLI